MLFVESWNSLDLSLGTGGVRYCGVLEILLNWEKSRRKMDPLVTLVRGLGACVYANARRMSPPLQPPPPEPPSSSLLPKSMCLLPGLRNAPYVGGCSSRAT